MVRNQRNWGGNLCLYITSTEEHEHAVVVDEVGSLKSECLQKTLQPKRKPMFHRLNDYIHSRSLSQITLWALITPALSRRDFWEWRK